jgi:hypothetical protein
MDLIERQVTRLLSGVISQSINENWPGPWDRARGRPVWTEGICASLFDEGRRQQLLPERGWLYDLTWSEMTANERGLLRRLPLVAEVEWQIDPDVDPDFMKLIQCRAEHRIFIFWESDASAIDRRISRYQYQIAEFHASHVNDRYLFCGLDRSIMSFRFSSYIHQLSTHFASGQQVQTGSIEAEPDQKEGESADS